MTYNLFIKYNVGGYNILDLPAVKLPIIIDAYKKGLPEFTVKGKTYNWGIVSEIRIFENKSGHSEEQIKAYCQENYGWIKVFGTGYLVSSKLLALLGSEVTDDVLGDIPFGNDAPAVAKEAARDNFIHPHRINALENIQSNKFDLSKLVVICEEINDNWSSENIFTVGLLLRTMINHVPPIFNDAYTTFDHVVANYSGSRSFKENMTHLNKSLRTIADGYNHELISKKEILPTPNQVDFRQNIDLLLGEIIKRLHD